MSTKQSLLLDEPVAFVIVNRPSVTVTVAVPSIQRVAEVGVPLTVSTPSTFVLKTPSKWLASPETTRTV